ncbi:EI24 domain-containing protein [Frigoribacterium faeni]|uniref:EI24 domain-containing protein n=1 Tax=Frigoribacterium faeni TaxID=145483 RepID=UPI0024130951|nr:EI24 domain-containing protein [Frigoribacterium faeni]
MSVIGEFFGGVGLLGRGLRLWATSPRLMLLGAVPALVVGAVFAAALVGVGLAADDLARTLTPFADGWPEWSRTLVRLGGALAVAALAVLLAVVAFTAVTLLVGDPFYERIWRRVEEREGDPPADVDRGFWRGLARSAGDSLRLLLATAGVGVLLFVGGFVPVLGQTVVPVLGALTGGWFLAVELTGYAFDARGRSLAERRRGLAVNRARTLGLGTATYLLFFVPLGAVLVMPAAVAAATLLAREVTTGPSTAGPTTVGPTTAGPTTAGPTTAGPSTAGPATPSPRDDYHPPA